MEGDIALWTIIIIIMVLQIILFIVIFFKIINYKNFISKKKPFEIIKVWISDWAITGIKPGQIFSDIEKYQTPTDNENSHEITLIKTDNYNKGFQKIISTINEYLIRNKAAISDYHLVKDIVDRNIDSEEDSIQSNLPIPLYLGLFGTMLGIILALILMPDLNHSQGDNILGGVDSILEGVRIAMIASALGLLLTTINSLFYYFTKSSLENKKNDFLSFIQAELLPILSQNTTSSLVTLQNNLTRFNENFSNNVEGFNEILKDVKKTFETQLDVVKELERIDISQIAKYNVNVLREMSKSFDKLKLLGDYLQNIQRFIESTNQLNATVNGQLGMIGDISGIVENFEGHSESVSKSSQYLSRYFEDFDSREQVMNNRLAMFDSNMDSMLEEVKKSFADRLKTFNEMDANLNSRFEDLFGVIHKGFEDMFDEFRKKVTTVFDDESQNISAIHGKVEVLDETVSGLGDKVEGLDSSVHSLSNLSGEIKELKGESGDLKKKNEKVLDQYKGKPVRLELPQYIIYSIAVAAGIASVSGIIFIVKTFI